MGCYHHRISFKAEHRSRQTSFENAAVRIVAAGSSHTRLAPFFRIVFSLPAPGAEFPRNRPCILESKELLPRQEAADGSHAGPTAGGRNLNHMIQRYRRGPLGRGPLSLTATAILLREDRNRDSPLQFGILQHELEEPSIRVELSALMFT